MTNKYPHVHMHPSGALYTTLSEILNTEKGREQLYQTDKLRKHLQDKKND